MPVQFEELELPFDEIAEDPAAVAEASVGPSACAAPPDRSPMGTFVCCPLCGGELRPEHAHFRCACGWRDSCCD